MMQVMVVSFLLIHWVSHNKYYISNMDLTLFFHTLGLVGGSTNFYSYAQNSPLNLKDPSGQILPLLTLVAPLLIRSGLGAVESVAFDVGLSLAEGKLPTLKGIIYSIIYLCFLLDNLQYDIFQDLQNLLFLGQLLDLVQEQQKVL